MQDNQQVAKHIFENVGGKPKVIKYKDSNETSAIDIFMSEDKPQDGVTTYATIGLSESSIGLVLGNDKELRAEFIGTCGSNFDKFPNIISSCAFNVINDNFLCRPGTVYPNVIAEYYADSEMKHILLTTPFLWENLINIETEQKVITWLSLIPISELELEYLNDNGSDALESLFEEKEIDIFDMYRESVL
ncbi:suppressor of fused domain protein [Listeria newyorkensis]|uniref:Suppressor of fused domain protein n=1 Tax=Listeria newyorkensis TaxID=1497681 RepID=A0A841YYK9_9LIST|nr:suppressor of fused domain protein [Listeria newyorkensis]MBC1458179.1 suppressor of fused domain protein [Listeria newyorkensis]